jgi:hypothetical protein
MLPRGLAGKDGWFLRVALLLSLSASDPVVRAPLARLDKVLKT